MFHAVCSPHDVVGADRSLHRLLLLYGATCSERDYEDEKMVSGVPKYTIDNSSSDLWRSAYSRTPRFFFSRLWWGRGKYTWRNTAAIYFKRSGNIPERNLRRTRRSRRKNFLTPSETLNCRRIKTNCCLQDFSNGIFWTTLWKWQHFAPAKRFSAVLIVEGLFAVLNIRYYPEEWWLVLGSSILSLKAVLLSKGNVLPSIPFASTVHKKEVYESKKDTQLHELQDICSDLKVIVILMWLQKSCTKFCCFLCEWDSRAKRAHYSKNWLLLTLRTPGTKNVAHQFFVDRCKVLLPTLHIKLGFMKNFVKVPYINGPEFSILREKFPRLSTETIKAGVFIGPQIRQLFTDLQFDLALSDDEKAAWNAFGTLRLVF